MLSCSGPSGGTTYDVVDGILGCRQEQHADEGHDGGGRRQGGDLGDQLDAGNKRHAGSLRLSLLAYW